MEEGIMMKWKARKETTNIGVLELGNVTFNEDFLEVSIDIFDMFEELKREVYKTIEIQKINDIKERDEWYAKNPELKKHERVWSTKPVIIDFTYLSIVLETGQPTKYVIEVGFHDADNDLIESAASVTVDLSEYTNELKKAIIKVMVDKFY